MTGGDSKLSGKKMEGEGDSVRTVDCLRGRLLAERSASRAANEEARKLENKLMELEKLLEQEVESRNRAEKRTKLLLKKLESMRISSPESRGEIVISRPAPADSSGSESNAPSSSVAYSGSEGQNGNFTYSEGDAASEGSSRLGSDRSDICYPGFRLGSEGDNLDGHDTRGVDDSMALVAVDENRAIDPEVLVMPDALKHAKEQLQSSMEGKRANMIRVG